MNDAARNLSDFEAKLTAIIASKEETLQRMREDDDLLFERYGKKTLEQIKLHRQFQKQTKTIQTSINVELSSAEAAQEFHQQILELINRKKYPIEEILWVRLAGTTKWNFTFKY